MNTSSVIVSVLALILSIIPHEVAHGYVAYLLGDPTASLKRRLTLNPIPHIDPIGSLLIPFVLIMIPGNPVVFGWAKPVPINATHFRNPKQGMMFVALAGPLTNFTLAAIAGGLFKLFGLTQGSLVGFFFLMLCVINVILGVLNLLPIPPLDGSRIVTGILPDSLARTYNKLERFGFIIILVFIFAGGLQYILRPLIQSLENMLGVGIMP